MGGPSLVARVLAALVSLLAAATCVEVRLLPTGGAGGAGGSGGAGGLATTTSSSVGAGGMGGSGGAGGSSCGCDQLDVLIAIDNSNSVDGVLGSLTTLGASLLPLLGIIESVSCDVHLGVVTAMPQLSNDQPACQVLGALSYTSSDDTNCLEDVPRNYATSADDPVVDRLLCLIQTGRQSGDDERLIEAVQTSLTDATLTGPGGCNEGFLREDAPLLLILITDIDDTQSNGSGTPALWYIELAALKQADTDKLITAALIPPPDQSCPEAEDAPNLHAFLDAHPANRSASTNICSPDPTALDTSFRAIMSEVCPVPGL